MFTSKIMKTGIMEIVGGTCIRYYTVHVILIYTVMFYAALAYSHLCFYAALAHSCLLVLQEGA